jgi:hypothetical protein
MMPIKPGDRVKHASFRQGVVISLAGDYARIFFADGERQVPLQALQPVLGRNETVVTHALGGEERAINVLLKLGYAGKLMNYRCWIAPVH